METKRKNEIVKLLTTARDGSTREYVTSSLEKGESYTFDKIGETQSFNGNSWVPIEDKEGHRMSISKVLYGKNVKFNSNKISDRVEAIINKVEGGGLKLKITDIQERTIRDADGNAVMQDGKEATTKVYSFNKELVG